MRCRAILAKNKNAYLMYNIVLELMIISEILPFNDCMVGLFINSNNNYLCMVSERMSGQIKVCNTGKI